MATEKKKGENEESRTPWRNTLLQLDGGNLEGNDQKWRQGLSVYGHPSTTGLQYLFGCGGKTPFAGDWMFSEEHHPALPLLAVHFEDVINQPQGR